MIKFKDLEEEDGSDREVNTIRCTLTKRSSFFEFYCRFQRCVFESPPARSCFFDVAYLSNTNIILTKFDSHHGRPQEFSGGGGQIVAL